MQLRYHGGGCCGVRHLIGFNDPLKNWRDVYSAAKGSKITEEQRNSYITNQVRGVPSANFALQYGGTQTSADTQAEEFERIMAYCAENLPSKTIEVILNDYQVNAYEGYWVGKLHEHGFKLVHRFYNNNNSWCNVFQKSFAKRDDKVPAWWAALDKPEEKKAA